jgi:hypothetical protein
LKKNQFQLRKLWILFDLKEQEVESGLEVVELELELE